MEAVAQTMVVYSASASSHVIAKSPSGQRVLQLEFLGPPLAGLQVEVVWVFKNLFYEMCTHYV